MNQDILGAFKSAIVRGYSIEITRQTLINSGYPLQEIDEAIQVLNGIQPQELQSQPTQQVQKIQPIQQPIKSIQQQVQFMQPIQQQQNFSQKNIQKVSAYENVAQKQQKSMKEKGSKIFIITLIVLLAILLGALIAVLIFKEQLVGMFSG